MSSAIDPHAEITNAERELFEVKKRVLELRRQVANQSVDDYTFQGSSDAPVALSRLFGDASDLIIIHNMGKGCPYCTLWADGLNGMIPHLENRAALAMASPDDPATQQEFAKSRGWQFTMVSTQGTTFSKDMGYETDDGKPLPGVSTFMKSAEGIRRTGTAPFGPGDDFCAVWPILDLLQDGPDGWAPKYTYDG